jgi:DNA invertase Pin-like site-specific DNA recombinase
MLICYTRASTNAQDLIAQRNALPAPGVDEDNIHVDHGLTGTNRERPGLGEVLAAVRAGDTLVVAKLDRLARALPDARDIADGLTRNGVALSLRGSVYDPNDLVGRLLSNVLGMDAEFEADLIRMRTREGMAVANAKGRLRGKKPKVSAAQERHLVSLRPQGAHATAEIAELFGVARSTRLPGHPNEPTEARQLRSSDRPVVRSPVETTTFSMPIREGRSTREAHIRWAVTDGPIGLPRVFDTSSHGCC